MSGSGRVAAGIGLSRVFGLVREVMIAATLGLTGAADAFRLAMRIPNIIQNLLGEGALGASFVPVYARLLEEDRLRIPLQRRRQMASPVAQVRSEPDVRVHPRILPRAAAARSESLRTRLPAERRLDADRHLRRTGSEGHDG